MGLRIELADEKAGGLSFAQGRVIIGRGGGCDIQLPDSSVSLQHLALEHVAGHWTATDLESTNGSWVAGSRLIPGRPVKIRGDGLVQVGKLLLRLTLVEAVTEVASDAQTRSLARALLRAELSAQGVPRQPALVVLSSLGQGSRVTIDSDSVVTVGRGDECELCIPDAELSREHLRARLIGGSLQLTDNQTKNGSSMDGRRFVQIFVNDGDEIQIGASTLLVEDPVDDILRERVALPDEKLPLARASRIPQQPQIDEDMAAPESAGSSPQRDATARGQNRKIQSEGSDAGFRGADTLLLAFAALLLVTSGFGLWLLLR